MGLGPSNSLSSKQPLGFSTFLLSSASYLGISQVPESLSGLQRLQELYYGCDATLGQQHTAQAAEAAEGLLQLRSQGTCWEVLGQDHGLASLCCSLQGRDECVGQQEKDLSLAAAVTCWL